MTGYTAALYKARAVPEAALLPPGEGLVEGEGLGGGGLAHGQAGDLGGGGGQGGHHQAQLLEQVGEVAVLGTDVIFSVGLLGLAVVTGDEGEQGGAAEAVLLRVQLLVVLLQLLHEDQLALLHEDLGGAVAVGQGDGAGAGVEAHVVVEHQGGGDPLGPLGLGEAAPLLHHLQLLHLALLDGDQHPLGVVGVAAEKNTSVIQAKFNIIGI